MNPADKTNPIALVIPAYNEAASLRQVATSALAQHPWVIVVDDGSTDATLQCVADLPLTLLRQPHNQGKAQALWRGMDHALQLGAAAVITMDADGQHRAVDLPRLLAAWHAHPDHIVIGTRLHDRSQFPLKRYLANRFANFWVAWAAGYPILDSQSGFRVYPAHLLRAHRDTCRQAAGFVFESEILIEAGRCGGDEYRDPHPRHLRRRQTPQSFSASGGHPAHHPHGGLEAVAARTLSARPAAQPAPPCRHKKYCRAGPSNRAGLIHLRLLLQFAFFDFPGSHLQYASR